MTPDDGAAETGEGESESGSEGTSAEGGASMSGGSMTSAGSMSASGSEEEGGEEGAEDVSSASASASAGEEEEGGVEEGSVEEGSASVSVTSGGEETGPAIPFACADLVCDALSEYCYEDIFDGPSEFHCLPIPDRCADAPTCACLVPIVCPESLQACEDVGGPITIECVTG